MVTTTSSPGSRTLSLKVLASAITKIESIRQLEHTCEVLGVQITLRPLQGEEEVEVQEFVAPAWREGRDEKASLADFMDRLRCATLSYALVRIDDVDLHDVEYIETGETDENGTPISLLKTDALRKMLAAEWTRPMLTQVFGQYGVLLDKLDARASKAVSYDPVDIDTEIERLERRLTDLRDAKEKATQAPVDPVQQRQRAVLSAQAPAPTPTPKPSRDPAADTEILAEEILERSGVPQAPTHQPSSQATPLPQEPQVPTTRRSAVPTAASAPSRPSEKVALEIDQETVQPVAHTGELERDERGRTVPLHGDSFFDPSDPDAALEVETRRQAEFVRESQQRQRERAEMSARRVETGVPDPREVVRSQSQGSNTPTASARIDPRTGGLRSAANTSNAVLDAGAGQIRTGKPVVRPTGGGGVPAQLHGKPVYQTPTQVIDRPIRTEGGAPPALNPEGGARNPNFRGPGNS